LFVNAYLSREVIAYDQVLSLASVEPDAGNPHVVLHGDAQADAGASIDPDATSSASGPFAHERRAPPRAARLA
jgi:hypothetical protein